MKYGPITSLDVERSFSMYKFGQALELVSLLTVNQGK